MGTRYAPSNPALPPIRWWVFSIYTTVYPGCLLHAVILIYRPVHLKLLITSLVCTYGEIYELLLRSTGRLHGVCRRSTSGSWARDVITALLHHRALSAVVTFHEKSTNVICACKRDAIVAENNGLNNRFIWIVVALLLGGVVPWQGVFGWKCCF